MLIIKLKRNRELAEITTKSGEVIRIKLAPTNGGSTALIAIESDLKHDVKRVKINEGEEQNGIEMVVKNDRECTDIYGRASDWKLYFS